MNTWTDWQGRQWRVVTSVRRLHFKYPAHAALRAHIFRRDGFRCVHCGARAINVPADYDGRNVLWTDTWVSKDWRNLLILDHVLTLKAGGRNVVENFQTLCETCNKRKGNREDKLAIAAHRRGG